MRIGHYSPAIFAKGGIGRYIQRLGAAQEARGHDVVYLSRNPEEASESCTIVASDRALFEAALARNLDILHLHKEVGVTPPPGVNAVRTMHGNQASCPSGSRYLMRSNSVCNRKYSKAVCTWGHVVDGCGSRKPSRIKAHLDRIEMEKAVLPHLRTLTVSEFLRKNMIREGYDAVRVATLLSPAPEVHDDPVPVPKSHKPRFVFLGRLVPQKGIEWLIRAMVHVDRDCIVDVGGDGYYLPDARQLARHLGVESKISFHGWVNSEAAAEMIRAGRAVIFPSVWHEPAGLVTLEAAAHARPVITANVGGIPEYADASFATVVEPHDEKALAKAIERFCDDVNLADSMGKAGFDYVSEHHSFDGFVDRLAAHYREVINANQAH